MGKGIKLDDGTIAPKICPKCGSKVTVYLQGEPIAKCSNKKCNTFFGVIACNIRETSSIDDNLELPEDYSTNSVYSLLDNTDKKRIFLSSDWHFFKNHYKKEHNYVNTQKIVAWCKKHIKDDDVFMYLGDISFRYANEKDQLESQRILSTIPGVKILILGNHDKMLGQDYFTNCGFDYVFEELKWQNIIFTHRPIIMDIYPDDYINIHGHIHNDRCYNTTDGKRNINVYPLWYDNKPVTLDYLLNNVEKLTKENYWKPNYGYSESYFYECDYDEILNETKRSELPDSAFGIPEDKKYPLDSKKHVNSAIKLFGHAEESKKKELAKRIKTASDKFNIDISKTSQCYKYLNESANIIPDNVNNIIFDMGNVLVYGDEVINFDKIDRIPKEYIDEINNIINDTLFHSKNPDIHYYNINKAKSYLRQNIPDYLNNYIDDIFEVFIWKLHTYDYTYELLESLKNKGYNLYYLSNWDRYSYEIAEEFFKPLLSYFNGGIFSFEVRCEKPSMNIYYSLINTYNLKPQECIFFDDLKENVEAAKNIGINAIQFDCNKTPIELLKELNPINIENNSDFLFINKDSIKCIDKSVIKLWYLSDHIKENINNYKDTLDDAINDVFNENNTFKDYYVYTKVNDIDVLLGIIRLYKDKSYVWQIQYTLTSDKLNGLELNEWAMAACNPVIGTHKPYILKIGDSETGSLFPTKFAFAPDIISDKYLVINENAELEVIDKSVIDNYYYEVYEYIGNMERVKRIEKAYKENKCVDNTFFYTTLTGKPMLTEDQIDFDSSFKKVNFELLKEKQLSTISTMKDEISKITCTNSLLNNIINESPIVYENNVLNKYNKYNNFSIKKDLDGYYFYNSSNNKRSASINNISSLTENMIKSIL